MSKHPTPKAGIMNIAPYVGGKSKAEGASRVIKLSSNENPWGQVGQAAKSERSAATSAKGWSIMM